MPKSNQLRVRLEDGQRERLLEIAVARGKGERLSDIVRHAISEFIAPAEHELADELNRSQSQVVEACVEGIQDILEKNRKPLIICEVNLRRKYHRKRPLKHSAVL